MTRRLVLTTVAVFGAMPVALFAQRATTRPTTALLYKSGDEVFPAAWSRTGRLDLYRLVLETGTLTRVTTTPWNDWHPSWSPDGRSIVFDADSGGGAPRLTVLDLASGATSPLTTGMKPEQGARWSPNGSRLAFHRHTGVAGDANYDVFVIDRATRHETRITNDLADSSSPSWSPDGRRLAFSSNRDGTYEIYVACADGSGVSVLTVGGPDKKYPLWSPDGPPDCLPAPRRRNLDHRRHGSARLRRGSAVTTGWTTTLARGHMALRAAA